MLMISVAWAQEAAVAGSAGNPWVGALVSYAPLILIFVIFYMLILRPQNQAAKAQAEMIAALKHGDVVQLTSGILAVIHQVHEKTVSLQVSPDSELMVLKEAVVKKLGDAEAKHVLGVLLETATGKRKK